MVVEPTLTDSHSGAKKLTQSRDIALLVECCSVVRVDSCGREDKTPILDCDFSRERRYP